MTLTVRFINSDAQENIFEATSVAFFPPEGEHPKTIALVDFKGEVMEMTEEGVYYVMNDNGSTIAKYSLWQKN